MCLTPWNVGLTERRKKHATELRKTQPGQLGAYEDLKIRWVAVAEKATTTNRVSLLAREVALLLPRERSGVVLVHHARYSLSLKSRDKTRRGNSFFSPNQARGLGGDGGERESGVGGTRATRKSGFKVTYTFARVLFR